MAMGEVYRPAVVARMPRVLTPRGATGGAPCALVPVLRAASWREPGRPSPQLRRPQPRHDPTPRLVGPGPRRQTVARGRARGRLHHVQSAGAPAVQEARGSAVAGG